jgi:hypothetical protein
MSSRMVQAASVPRDLKRDAASFRMPCGGRRRVSRIAYFETLEEPRRSIAYALHARFAAAGPHLAQRSRWGYPAFVGNADVASIAGAGKAKNAHVHLQLFKGAALPNPDGLIEGTGKSMRHIKFRALSDVERPGVDAAIRAAVLRDAEDS